LSKFPKEFTDSLMAKQEDGDMKEIQRFAM
jgi:hypothetical protein